MVNASPYAVTDFKGTGKDKKKNGVSALKKRAKHVAVERAQTPAELDVTYSGNDAFGLFEMNSDERPSLRELYGDMDTLRAAPRNGFKSFSMFSGGGGSGTGFKMAGWEELGYVEFVKAARESIKANYPETYIVEPQVVTDEVMKWFEKHPDALIPVPTYRKSRHVKGMEHGAMIEWDVYMGRLANKIKEDLESGNAVDVDAIWEQFFQMRDEVNDAVFSTIPDGMVPCWGDDIRFMSGESLMKKMGLESGELDCLEASPPCKSYSMSGGRDKLWGYQDQYSEERRQRTDDLFVEYARILRTFRPKSFIAENVKGITVGKAKDEVLLPLIENFTQLGYNVRYKVIESSDHGVPQRRPRTFIIGIRNDLHDANGYPLYPEFPAPWDHKYTLRDALEAADPSTPDELEQKSCIGTAAGDTWATLKPGQSPKTKQYQLTRCNWDLPVPTITASDANYTATCGPMHPDECRKFTTNEMKMLFGYPTDYQFVGTTGQQGERMGRSVPPFTMKQLSEKIAEVLSKAVYDDGK